MKKLTGYLRGIICISVLLLSATGSRAVEGVASTSVFYLPEAGGFRPYLELCWQINPYSLHYRKNEAGLLSASVQTDIVVLSDTGVVARHSYLLQTLPAPPEVASAQNLLELQRLYLPAGKFEVRLSLSEPEFAGTDFLFSDSVAADPAQGPPFFSGIQLVDTQYATKDSSHMFFRNGMIHLPLATNFLDEGRNKLGFYAELYGSELADTATFPLYVHTYISRREDGGIVRNLQRQTAILPAAVVPVGDTFDLSVLNSGNYFLHVKLTDRYDQPLSARTLFFQLVNKNPVVPEQPKHDSDTAAENIVVLDMSKTFLAKYTLPQIRAMMEMLLPVTEAADRKAIENFLRKPDEVYMRYFVYNYFQRTSPDNPEKGWKDYSDRVREVNRLFGNAALPGYKTDRGFIYLKYGKPDDRVIILNEPGALPYELWEYLSLRRQEGSRAIFLFYQPGSSVSDFQLLHSTVYGEMRNGGWRNILYSRGSQNANKYSRAEEFLRER